MQAPLTSQLLATSGGTLSFYGALAENGYFKGFKKAIQGWLEASENALQNTVYKLELA